jgi:hypothetical protein
MNNAVKALLVSASLSPLAMVPASLPVAACLAVESSFGGGAAGNVGQEFTTALFVMAVAGTVVAYLLMAVVGLPVAAVALRVNQVGLRAAAAVGVLVALLFSFFVGGGEFTLRAVLLTTWSGLAVSSAFWFLFHRFHRFYARA